MSRLAMHIYPTRKHFSTFGVPVNEASANEQARQAGTLTHSFPWDMPGKWVRAFCGVTISQSEYSSTPTCPRCAERLAEIEAAPAP